VQWAVARAVAAGILIRRLACAITANMYNRVFFADSGYGMDNGSDDTVPLSDVVGHAFVLIWPRAGSAGWVFPVPFIRRF
jgi:hypothetical protein